MTRPADPMAHPRDVAGRAREVHTMLELRYGTNVYRDGRYVANLAGVTDEELAAYVKSDDAAVRLCAVSETAHRFAVAHAPVSDRPCRCDGIPGQVHHSGVNGCNFGPGAYRFRRV